MGLGMKALISTVQIRCSMLHTVAAHKNSSLQAMGLGDDWGLIWQHLWTGPP